MDACVKDHKITLAHKQSEKLHKSSLVLSFVSILLTLVLFVRTEKVVHDAVVMDLKFMKQIQQL